MEVDGAPRYIAIWAAPHSDGEKAAFERLIDMVIERASTRTQRCTSTTMAAYEAGAIKRLMQRHATSEDEVDRLLRGGVLVDLLNVVRQGVRASVESYS